MAGIHISPLAEIWPMSLSIVLRQALHGLFSGTQALPKNRGAYVSTNFRLKWRIHSCQGKMPNDLVEIWLSRIWVGISWRHHWKKGVGGPSRWPHMKKCSTQKLFVSSKPTTLLLGSFGSGIPCNPQMPEDPGISFLPDGSDQRLKMMPEFPQDYLI